MNFLFCKSFKLFTYFFKDAYLKPALPLSSSPVPLLSLDDASSTGSRVYMCGQCNGTNYSHDPRAVCVSCRRQLITRMVYVAPPTEGGGGLVKGVVTYMVMDDLVVNPMSTISSLALLNKFNVKDVGALEEKVVNLGMEEGLKLLKASLQSNNVLTDVFC